MSKQKKYPSIEQERIVFATHEAGHAVVGHVIGRLIDEVSIVADREHGYKGYYRFAAFAESLHDHNQWQKESGNTELVTIRYAGMVAVEIVCKMRRWNYEQWRYSDMADEVYIDDWCSDTFANEKQPSQVKHACFQQARKILLQNWDAVNVLAVDLLQYGWTPGNEAHRMI